MGLFDTGRRNVLENGVEGTARILETERQGHESPNQGEPWPWEIAMNRVGSRRYHLVLEVRIPAREPYTVRGRFKVPRKAENISLFNIGNVLPQGLELPVRVDPGDSSSLAIDWERFLASPGRKQAMKEGTDARRLGNMKKELDRNPKLAAKHRANNRLAVQAWVAAVSSGNMSREEFERTVDQEVASGRMDPADAEAGRRALGEPGEPH